MCWAVPVKIIEIKGQMGIVEIAGTRREVGLHVIEDPREGDYVLLHAGFAIQKLDTESAKETLSLWDEMGESFKKSEE